MSSVSKAGCHIILMCILTLTIPLLSPKAADVQSLQADALVQSRTGEPLPASTLTFLQQKNPNSALVWVYFTDKGVFDKAGFDQRASSVRLSDKVLRRRAKVEKTEVVFADLPVVESYVQQIAQLGGKHRRTSRWLNAASYEIPMDQLQAVALLPFVRKIVPVAGFKMVPEEIQPISPDNQKNPHPADALALNYGYAQAQLAQIHVPEVHNKGFDGSGVTLAMFDTGFRKSHEAFANAYAEGRVLAEYDFIFNDANTANEPVDWSSQWDHGTLTWSTAGGYKDGSLYGPAYKANFLLAKTEDVRSETPVEEDNWVAALEWADSLGADVISSSLGYSDWYTYVDFDGQTATISIAAGTAAGLGIVVCNSMGNSGPGAGSLSAPADAFDIVAVGAVNSSGDLASFSSRGPTYDGRTKPEVCARGVSTSSASSSADNAYTTASGTSLSTPLIAGVACLLIQAHPTFPPGLIRESLMMTADNAATPNNDYGWGLANADAALSYGANFSADVTKGQAPLEVQFTDISPLTVNSWSWDFGDGGTSTVQNPLHDYTTPGAYTVTLTVGTHYGDITNSYAAFILALGDTVTFVPDTVSPGEHATISVRMVNSQPLERIVVPFKFYDSPQLVFDSVTKGSRTSYFEDLSALSYDPWNHKFTFRLTADNGGGALPLPVGSGEIMKMYFTVDASAPAGATYVVDTATTPYSVSVTSIYANYAPEVQTGSISTRSLVHGDVDNNGAVDIADLVALVEFSFSGGPAPDPLELGDVNGDSSVDIGDVVYLVEYMFAGGPPPVG